MQIVSPAVSSVLPVERTLLAALAPALSKTATFAVSEPAPAAYVVAATVQPATSVQMLVAMAATIPGADPRARATARADAGLRALAQLDADVRNGRSSVESVAAIAAWSAKPDLPFDGALADILRDIELRVEVELAKHEIVV